MPFQFNPFIPPALLATPATSGHDYSAKSWGQISSYDCAAFPSPFYSPLSLPLGNRFPCFFSARLLLLLFFAKCNPVPSSVWKKVNARLKSFTYTSYYTVGPRSKRLLPPGKQWHKSILLVFIHGAEKKTITALAKANEIPYVELERCYIRGVSR